MHLFRICRSGSQDSMFFVEWFPIFDVKPMAYVSQVAKCWLLSSNWSHQMLHGWLPQLWPSGFGHSVGDEEITSAASVYDWHLRWTGGLLHYQMANLLPDATVKQDRGQKWTVGPVWLTFQLWLMSGCMILVMDVAEMRFCYRCALIWSDHSWHSQPVLFLPLVPVVYLHLLTSTNCRL